MREIIRKFQIRKMTLSGFKCFERETTLDFGALTLITGGNGRGKSSIADAIAFAVTGLPFFGERGIDRLHCEQNGDLSIDLEFVDEKGTQHRLARTRQKGRMSIAYDGQEVRQLDLTEMFGEKDVFLSILNPLYFIEELGEDGRKLLERYLPNIPQETILSHLDETVQAALREERILSPEAFAKKTREEIRELEERIIYLRGQRDLSEKQREEAETKLDELSVRCRALQEEQDALKARQFEGMNLPNMREQLVELSTRYEELARDSAQSADTRELDQQLHELSRHLGKRSAEQYVPKYAQPIAEQSVQVNALATQYRRQAAILKQFKPGMVCPTCLRSVTDQDFPSVQKALNEALQQTVAQGREAKGKLDELNALESKSAAVFQQYQEQDVAGIQNRIQELTKRREALCQAADQENESRSANLDALREQMRGLSADLECGRLTPEEWERLNSGKVELDQCQAAYAAAEVAANSSPDVFEEQISSAQDRITACKHLLSNLTLYMSKRAELLFANLSMNRVQISLFDVVKTTGEVKDVFKFTYNGRRYDRLSLSEKIRAGMEVSELVKRLTGRNYPQFVDNMESVDDLKGIHPTGQVIMARCESGKALEVRPASPARKMPRAA